MSQNHRHFSFLTAITISLSLTSLTASCTLTEFPEFPEVPITNPASTGVLSSDYSPMDQNWSAAEQAILAEHNQVRQNPQSYIPLMEAWLDSFTNESIVKNGVSPGVDLITKEGKAAVLEAIEYLRQQPPVGPLQPSIGLANSAADHLEDQSQTGKTGHDGSDGSDPATRMKRYGLPFFSGENIAYGPTTAQQVVMQLIIDDDVPDRGHRTNIFTPEFKVAGVACGSHLTFRTMCVINYAQGYLEDPNTQVSDLVFKVSNQSDFDITEIYLTSVSESDWENRWSQPLGNNYTGTYSHSALIRGNSQVCEFNIRAVMATGEEKVANNINLCEEVYTLSVP
ncbi:MAG: CAP domain-containing protein [Spirulinaceae cyanobacterium]